VCQLIVLVMLGVNFLHIAEVNERLRQELQSAQRRIRVLEADLDATRGMVNR
jgi:hypothetical protein